MNKREAKRIGKLARGIPKTFEDRQVAIDQRRQAGIASGKARKGLKRGPYKKREPNLADLQRTINDISARLR